MGEYSAYRRIGMELGLKEGLKEGREKGLAEGREKGLVEGRVEGIFEGKAEIIRQMYNNGMKKEHIEEITGVPVTEINKMLAK